MRQQLNYHGSINFVPHHLSHAANSYYLSGFDQAVTATLDGVGEWATTTVGVVHNNKLEIKKEIRFPHSLGLLYSAITTYLGFKANNDEFKVMGLAAYGDAKKYAAQFAKLVTIYGDGSFALNMKYFSFDWAKKMYSPELIKLFNHSPRQHGQKLKTWHQDVAAGLQTKLEEIVLNLLNKTHHKYQIDNLCLGGGVALNSVLNGKILNQTPFAQLYIAPDPSDAGGAIGAALYLAQEKNPQFDRHQTSHNFSPYLGPGYSWHQIQTSLDQHQLKYQLYQERDELLAVVADHLIDKKIVG